MAPTRPTKPPKQAKRVRPVMKPLPPEPTGIDPFAESTLQRRLWALRVAKRMSRVDFASDVGVSYTTVDAWDRGAMPSFANILDSIKVLKLGGAEVLMLLFGISGEPPAPGQDPDPPLGEVEVSALLRELRADAATRNALRDFRRSPEGKHRKLTRLFVQGFVFVHKSSREAGATEAQALQLAVDGGFTQRSRMLSVMSGGMPMTAEQLRAAADEIERSEQDAAATKRKPRRR